MEGLQGHKGDLPWGQAHCEIEVHHARQDADKAVFENIDPKASEVFRLANQMKENADVVSTSQLEMIPESCL